MHLDDFWIGNKHTTLFPYKIIWQSLIQTQNISSVFNLGFADSLLGSVSIIISALYWVSWFRQSLDNFSKVLPLEKRWKTQLFMIVFEINTNYAMPFKHVFYFQPTHQRAIKISEVIFFNLLIDNKLHSQSISTRDKLSKCADEFFTNW